MTKFETTHRLSQAAPCPLEPMEKTAQQDDTLLRTGNTADHQAGWFAGIEQGQVNAQHNAQVHAQAEPQAYGASAEVASRIEQYIAHYGRENTAGLLLYEAMKALRAPAAGDARDAAARDVLAERQRQISAEGWTPEHDDAHTDGALAQAAACYAASSQSRDISYMAHLWPWSTAWWKPGTSRGDLVKAGALILAEIERQDRAAIAAQRKGDAC